MLEVTARAITYYLDVSSDCTKKIVSIDGTLKAICKKLYINDQNSRTALDLAEQNVKVLEHICTREAGAIFEANGLNAVFTFIKENGHRVHKDTLHSAMVVVSRLCCKVEPNDPSIENCVQSLSNLLKSDDQNVADGALRCFASLLDRFTRRNIDPAPLAEYDLIPQLLARLNSVRNCNQNHLTTSNNLNNNLSSASSNLNTVNNKNSLARLTAYAVVGNEPKTAQSISTVISLLSTLCRGSPQITNTLLLHSQFASAIESALAGDERCILDTMRLIDLLILLIFEGRSSLPKSTICTNSNCNNNSSTTSSSLTKLTSSSFRRISVNASSSDNSTHRQLIECIRNKDTDALIQSIVSGNIEPNFTDDVGQTLLNWTSAFGTEEMIRFLCEKGGDVNKGQRSSSLHYAACFGRPNIVKILLQNGANPDLRDEEGKTALDKARERNDEAHREVANLLQSPAEWSSCLLLSSSDNSLLFKNRKKKIAKDANNTTNQDSTAIITNESTSASSSNNNRTIEIDPTITAINEPELVNSYIKKLLPIFCNTYQSSMIRQIKKSSLSLIRKIVFYMNKDQLIDLNETSICSQIVEVISNCCLDYEEDEECCLLALQMIQDLLDKEFNLFLDHFARLGVFNKVQLIAGINELNNNRDSNLSKSIYSSTKNDQQLDELDNSTQFSEDAKEVLIGRPYHWRDTWNIVLSRGNFY